MSFNFTSNYVMDDNCSINLSKLMPFYTVRLILLVTVFVLVFYVGQQRWRRQCSFKTASHSDIFTYHMAAMELIWVLGCLVMYCSTYTNHLVSATVGSYASNIAYYGEIFFHLLTCVERYLAVVHPSIQVLCQIYTNESIYINSLTIVMIINTMTIKFTFTQLIPFYAVKITPLLTLYVLIFFHLLTCVEHYLSAVHPTTDTYMSLRNARGVRIRNICICCVWLLCFGLTGVVLLLPPKYKPAPLFCILVPSIIIITFCSLSVLCVLIRPGPGEGGGEKDMVAKSKLRAFYTMMAITCAVWLWVVAVLLYNAFSNSRLVSSTAVCLVSMYLILFNFPSCLVLPLLYLHRAGKFSCCCYTNK